tara:strand:- start:9735 stop:10148 length:414 start_codon:yes stop_codon:yes gene_type:complete
MKQLTQRWYLDEIIRFTQSESKRRQDEIHGFFYWMKESIDTNQFLHFLKTIEKNASVNFLLSTIDTILQKLEKTESYRSEGFELLNLFTDILKKKLILDPSESSINKFSEYLSESKKPSKYLTLLFHDSLKEKNLLQ